MPGRSSANRTSSWAPGALVALRSSVAALIVRCAPYVSLDEAERFLHDRIASVATLRWCSGSSRNAVRVSSNKGSPSPESPLAWHDGRNFGRKTRPKPLNCCQNATKLLNKWCARSDSNTRPSGRSLKITCEAIHFFVVLGRFCRV